MLHLIDRALAIFLNLALLFNDLIVARISRRLGAALLYRTVQIFSPLIKQEKLPCARQVIVSAVTESEFLKRVSWTELKAKVALQNNISFRSQDMKRATVTYWLMGNFDMAREAARDWVALTTYESLNANEAKQAFELIHKIDRIQKNYSYERDHKNQAKNQNIAKLYDEMRRHQYGRYQHYRDARTALLLLSWSATQNDEPSRRALTQIHSEKITTEYLKFDEELATRMGMPESEFSQMQKEAEKIER